MYRSICLILCLFLFLFLFGCGQASSPGNLNKVGLLVPDTIDDQVWGTKGYKGLLKIQSRYNIETFYKESMVSEAQIRSAVKEFHEYGVNLIFGHGSEYEVIFNKLAKEYPDIHFVFFNGKASGENITSINFKSNAMGFFGGMVAGNTTETNKVGVIAAYEWQPEVTGFFEGAYYENEDVDVEIKYTGDWYNEEEALGYVEDFLADGVDVIYPAGDGFNVPVIERIKEDGAYAIGFVSDQSDLGGATVLTSTVQHVAEVYEIVASRYAENNLESGNLFFDFQENAISLGTFSSVVDKQFVHEIKGHIENYKETGLLPNQNE